MAITIVRKAVPKEDAPQAVPEPAAPVAAAPEVPTEQVTEQVPAPAEAPSPFAEVLALSVGTEKPAEPLPPWEVDETYTILDAMSEMTSSKHKGKTLTLVSRKDSATSYIVRSYDPDTRRAILEGGFKGGQLKPVITEREVPLYFPVWR